MSSRPIPALGFVAPSGSGKTTLIRQLVPHLRQRGLRVGYLKHAHHSFDLDVPGKDSYALREAGANQTLLASKARWALQSECAPPHRDPDLEEMLARFDADALDLVLVEGFKHATFPKLEIRRTAAPGAPLSLDDPDVIALVTDCEPTAPVRPTVLPLDAPDIVAEFIVRQLEDGALGSRDPRAELVRYYQLLRRYGYNDGHSGNASIRVGDWFYVTPTGASADELRPTDLICCPLEGEIPPGASLDAPLHRAVYLAQPEARAILHSHGAYSVGVSFGGQDFRPADFEGQYYFEAVPVISIDYARYVEESPAKVAEALAASTIAIVRGHGVYAWGTTLDFAYKWTGSLELSAKTYVIARQAAAL